MKSLKNSKKFKLHSKKTKKVKKVKNVKGGEKPSLIRMAGRQIRQKFETIP